jgi:hypothetical protein
MAITKKSDRQEVISAIIDINATDFATTVIGTGTAVTLEAIDLPEGAVVVGGNLSIVEAFNTEAVRAYGVLTSSAAPADTNTVTIGTTVYTFKTALTASTTAFEVLIGADEAASLNNLAAAINLGAGAGTTYGSLTTVHPEVTAVSDGVHALTVTSKLTSAAHNALDTTETHANGAWGAATLVDAVVPADTLVAQIGAVGYIASVDADVVGTLVSVVPVGTVLTTADTVDVIWDAAATTTLAPTLGKARLIIEYIVNKRAKFSQG